MSDAGPSLDGPPWDEDAPLDQAPERDPNTEDMFGAPEPAAFESGAVAGRMLKD
eukprot:gene37445-60745_t